MTSNRPEKVAGLLQREVTDIISRHLRDPRVQGVTVTDAEVSGDLKHATIFVSTLADGKEREATLDALNHAAGAVRARVEEILRRLKSGESLEEDEALE
jgi:ribosome-binding factor A